MPNAVMFAFTSPTSPETDAEFNAWYDEKHLPEVAQIEGVVGASRYRVDHDVETLPGVGGPTQRYLAIYELSATTSEELGRFTQNLRDALAEGRADIHPTLDQGDLGALLALPIGPRLTGISA